jgi:hypothetical protein
MTLTLDKPTLIIFIVIFLITAGAALILGTIRPSTTADVSIVCEQINFDTLPEEDVQTQSLLSTRLWVTGVTAMDWSELVFRVPGAWASTDSLFLTDNGVVTIVPNSANARIEILSVPDAFSVRDIFVKGSVRISWGVSNSNHRIAVQSHDNDVSHECSVVLSTGDNVQLRLLDCVFLGRDKEILYETTPGIAEEMVFPISFSTSEAVLISTSGRIKFTAHVQEESPEERTVLIRDINITNVDCLASEYTPAGQTRQRNTVLRGSVARRKYDPGDSFEIRQGEFIEAEPPTGYLEGIRAGSESVEASLMYHVNSLTVGSERAQHQLVRSKLQTVSSNQTLLLIYATAMAVFGFATRFLTKKKDN